MLNNCYNELFVGKICLTLPQDTLIKFYQQRPITPVVYYQQTAVANKSLKGLEIDPFERSLRLNKLYW